MYTYAQVLDSYNTTKTLPQTFIITPWIAISNPDKAYNFRSGKSFDTIQAAINDVDTKNNDIITLGNKTFSENIIVNKSLSIISLAGYVTVEAANHNLPVFIINSAGSGSQLLNLIIKGFGNNAGIYINNSDNNTIGYNNITTSKKGILIENSNDTQIYCNNIINNTENGLSIFNGNNISITQNNIANNNANGIFVNAISETQISQNTISSNLYDGIYLNNSIANINFNSINGNARYGLHNEGNGTINALNNWWGTNSPNTSSTTPSDIYVTGGFVNSTEWLVMNVTSSCDRSNRTGQYYNYKITVDITHNNHGNDTSNDSSLPDGLPLVFNTTLGAVTTPSTTKGRAIAALNSTSAGLASVSVTLNNQNATIPINITSINVLGVYNNRTNQWFTTIQTAIDSISTLNGDTITLNEGTYTENIIINKSLTIKPATGQNVIVQVTDPETNAFTIISTGSGSKIQGFTINGCLNAIFLNSTNNCNVTGNNISSNSYGIHLVNSTNNTITENYATQNFCGIYLQNSTNNTIPRNILRKNFEGIYLENSNNNILLENIINLNCDGVYLYYSNSTISGNNITENEFGIYSHISNSTISGNNVTSNSDGDIIQVNSIGIVMATSIYNCGPAALATVLNKMGITTTQDELATLSGTDESGTTMYGLAQAAQAKGLIAKGIKLSVDQLRPNNIVFLVMNGENHYSIIRNITNTTVYLADPLLGNIERTLEEFNAAYSGNALIITNNTNDPQLTTGTQLTNEEMQNIKGKGAWVSVWVKGWFWSSWEWVYSWGLNIYPAGTIKASSSAWGFWYTKQWRLKWVWWKRVYGWHTKRVYVYTLPWNYVRYFHPPFPHYD